MTSLRRRGRVGAAVLALVTTGAGCGSSAPDEFVSQPRPVCADVYASSYSACVSGADCAGLQCLYVMQYCGANARRDVGVCCATNFPDAARYEECVDSLGQSP